MSGLVEVFVVWDVMSGVGLMEVFVVGRVEMFDEGLVGIEEGVEV